MTTGKWKKQRLWVQVKRSEGGIETILNEPVNIDSTIGDFMELERLLNKIYGPTVTFSLGYLWKDKDLASAAEVLKEGTHAQA